VCKIGEHLRSEVFRRHGAVSCPAPVLTTVAGAGVKPSPRTVSWDAASRVCSPEGAGSSKASCWGTLWGQGRGLRGCSPQTGPSVASCPAPGFQQRSPTCSQKPVPSSPPTSLPRAAALRAKSAVPGRDFAVCLPRESLLAALVGRGPACAASRSPWSRSVQTACRSGCVSQGRNSYSLLVCSQMPRPGTAALPWPLPSCSHQPHVGENPSLVQI